MSFDPTADITISESPEALKSIEMERQRDALLDARDTQADLHKVGTELYGEGHICTPEEKEDNAEQFQLRYADDIDLLLGNDISEKIAAHFEKKGDLEAAVFLAVSEMEIPDENKEDATERITEYLNPRETSLRIDAKLKGDGITVLEGMNASYIAALSGSNRSFTFTSEANALGVGDTLSYGADEETLMNNNTSIGELDVPDEGIPEIFSKEFMESRYYPIIQAYENIPGEKGIPGDKVEEIENLYTSGEDIATAMGEILGVNHDAVSQAQDLDNPDKINERRQQMYSDLNVEESCKFKPEEGKGGDIVTNIISENYTRILGDNGETDTKASVLLAAQIGTNKIIEGKHTFKRTPEFEQAYERIMSGEHSAEELHHDISLIHKTVNDAEGIRGKGKLTEVQRIKKAKQKSMFLDAEFQEIQELLLQAETKQPQETNEGNTSKDLNIPSGGEVFTAGVLDVANLGSEEVK